MVIVSVYEEKAKKMLSSLNGVLLLFSISALSHYREGR